MNLWRRLKNLFGVDPLAEEREDGDLRLGQKVPNTSESSAVGAPITKIFRGTPEFEALTKHENPDIVFKDEEGDGSDHMMTAGLSESLDALATLVKQEWTGVKLRVTEAWDGDNEHGARSTHYEGRGADLTTSDKDSSKLGRLGRLAVNAGFDWVWYEDTFHVHASLKRD